MAGIQGCLGRKGTGEDYKDIKDRKDDKDQRGFGNLKKRADLLIRENIRAQSFIALPVIHELLDVIVVLAVLRAPGKNHARLNNLTLAIARRASIPGRKAYRRTFYASGCAPHGRKRFCVLGAAALSEGQIFATAFFPAVAAADSRPLQFARSSSIL